MDEIEHKLLIFIENIPVNDLAAKIVQNCNENLNDITDFLNVYINEMQGALSVVKPYLDINLKFLEVGSGLCFFSLFLKSEGFCITALEPAAGGFDKFLIAKKVILKHFGDYELPVMDKKAQHLDALDGEFDVIFSNNVIEHIPELDLTLLAASKVLSVKGKMIHGCPNYVIPYEPHFNILIFKFWPGLSELLYEKKIAVNKGVWRSLNFVTYYNITSFAKVNNMKLSLRKEMIYQAFKRLGEDPYFRKRQSSFFLWFCYLFLEKTKLISLLKFWPAQLATPMIVELTKK